MIVGIICTVVLGLIALWQARRAAHWMLVARVLGRDVALEKAKRKAFAMAIGDLHDGMKRGDAALCSQAIRTATRVASDDSEETLRALGFRLPALIGEAKS